MKPALNKNNKSYTPSFDNFRIGALIAGPLAMLLILIMPSPEGMEPQAWTLVALTSWMIVWWLSEAVPIPATALLPIPLMPLFGIGEMKMVASNYGHPLIFLFLGGFLLAVAMQKWGLHRRIALRIISLVGTNQDRVIGGFMIATAFLSMWISNTSTTIMMYAVALSVIDFVARQTSDENTVRRFGVSLMLCIAYSATIGGVGTLIGTPTNALLASFLSSSYGIKIDFFTWMTFGVPIVLAMLPIAWIMLTKVIFPSTQVSIGDVGTVIKQELGELGSMSKAEKAVAYVFLGAALGWMFRQQVVALTGLSINDTTIALCGAMVLFAWPIVGKKTQFVLEWEDTKDLPWGVLLLFGGGLALAAAFDHTGLSVWIGEAVTAFDVNIWLMIFVVIITVIFSTEITSNTASAATFLPVLGAVAIGMEIDPRMLAIPATVAASMAFMMPVATPPNAIVFTYEKMRLFDMVKAGFWLNIIAIAVTFASTYLLVKWVFNI